MIKIKFLFLLSLSLVASSVWAGRTYQEIIHDLLLQKTIIDEQVTMVVEADKAHRPLTGFELNAINVATANRLQIRAEAYDYFEKSRYLLKGKKWNDRHISTTELKELIRSLAVATTLFDMGLYSYNTFSKSKRLTTILNEEDMAFSREGYTFEKSTRDAFRISNRKHLARALYLYEVDFKVFPEYVNDPDLKIAQYMIDNSYYTSNVQQKGKLAFVAELLPLLKTKLSISLNDRKDMMSSLGKRIFYGGSKVFGNLVGGFQKRMGLLYQNEEFIKDTAKVLKPLDILLEKTPFRLTDSFIPGFWGHTAIYIGTVDEIKALGLWDHPLIEQRKDSIEDGKLIVEALRTKVKLSSLEEFSNIDDFAVLRYRTPLTATEQREHILRALSHLDKKYDFNFDVESGSTIVCSELPYRTFIGLNFKTTRMLSRSTISVDQVAEVAMDGQALEPVILYIDGKKIDQDTQVKFDGLLAETLQKELLAK